MSVGLLAAADPAPLARTTVGMGGTLEAVVLPGSELEAKPLTDHKTPVVLRVVRVYPHGSAFRYDLDFFGLEPGTHDLRAYLKRKDGTPTGELPPLFVAVSPVLPPGRIEPNKLEVEPGPRLGGYRLWVRVLGTVWALVLVGLLASFVFPRRRKIVVNADRPLSLADKLRPLVEGALAGQLSREELAGLERGLHAYWRKRLGLEAVEPAAAFDALRKHPDAGPLVGRLELWLHRPGPPEPVDVPALLAPYRDLPADAFDLPAGKGGAA